MSDIVERCQQGSCKRHSKCMYTPCYAVPLFRTDLTEKPVDQFLTENNEILRAEITRLQTELAEARDKALDEASEAVCGYIHPAYGELPGEPFASAAIRALKSPKPQED